MNDENPPAVLIVEDERPLSLAIAATVESCGGTPSRASTLARAREAMKETRPAAIVLDIGLPDGNGLELLPEVENLTPVIVVTAHGEIENAIEARKRGVHEFFDKPIEFESFRECLSNLLREARKPERVSGSKEFSGASFIGAAPAMRLVFQRIAQACASSVPVLVTGDTGTGKSTVARLIGRERTNSTPEMIDLLETPDPIKSADSMVGKLAVADPITGLTLEEQSLLAQALENATTAPAQIIATSSCDLRDRVESGTFLSELYYRLQVLEIKLPTLAHRSEDIPALANFFLGRLANESVQFDPAALDALITHDWPGNLRELSNAVVYANTLRGNRPTIDPSHLPDYLVANTSRTRLDQDEVFLERAIDRWLGETDQLPDYKTLSGKLDKILIERLIERFDGKLAPMARTLKANRTTLRKRLDANS